MTDPYAILAGWIAYAEERPMDRDAQELRKLSEAALEDMLPVRDMGELGK